MRLFPAIDIKNGKCVRLKQGLFDQMNIYGDEPYEIAKKFEQDGARYIHVVDLDGALAGHEVNDAAIKKIAGSVSIPIEVGGGIRTDADIEEKFALGVSRVVIGTKAVEEPEFVKRCIAKYSPSKISVGIDAKNGKVAIKGWESVSELDAVDFALTMKKAGVRTIIYTDISKDGMLCGPNIEKTTEMMIKTDMKIVASGGVSCIEDLCRLEKAGIYGVIIGKAIYEKKIELKKAIELFETI
jgi:phosphoribosylformimino-5-aminoimidazole carboxamide ribotide isomerase